MIKGLITLLFLLIVSPAWAVFPTVEATNTSEDSTGDTSIVVSLPASIQSGDLLIVAIMQSNSTATNTYPAGWVKLSDDNGSVNTYSTGYRHADGLEGATVTITSTQTGGTSHFSYRISGPDAGTNPEVGVAASGSSINPDPPSLNPTNWGAEDTLWIIGIGTDNAASSVATDPTNYTNPIEDSTGTSIYIYSARRELNAASEDPGTATLDASDQWIAQTIAVRPAAVTRRSRPIFLD